MAVRALFRLGAICEVDARDMITRRETISQNSRWFQKFSARFQNFQGSSMVLQTI
jgi:hypothetical protein